jgi:hypothetical protein
MMATADKKPVSIADRDAIRRSFAGPAWSIWTELARGDAMADSADRTQMMERHKIVVAMIEVNSQQLRCDSAAAGLDIERLNARRDVETSGGTPESKKALEEVERRASEVEEKKRKLAQERDWLETSLTEFDGRMAANAPQTKSN